MNGIAGLILFVMPEIYGYETFSLVMNTHLSSYFYSNNNDTKNALIGGYAATFLTQHIIKLCDNQLYNSIKSLKGELYIFPVVSGSQIICQPFNELLKLWDFLVCFGLHLNPVITAAQIIENKNKILSLKTDSDKYKLLNQRNWLNGSINAKTIIDITMKCIIKLKKPENTELWNDILKHASNIKIAKNIKLKYQKRLKCVI